MADSTRTQIGTVVLLWWPEMLRASSTTPAVLAASCRPWPKAIAAADAVWARRKPRVTRPGLALRKIQKMAVMKR